MPASREWPSRRRCLAHSWNGSWVRGAREPPAYYDQAAAAARTNPQSKNIVESPMCRRQQSWRWRWSSHDIRCPFHRPTRGQLCERLAGRRIMLVGDSLTQQFFVSLASLAGTATAMPRPKGCESMRHVECVRICGSSGRSAELCQRTKFGLALDALPSPPHNCTIHPSTVQPLGESFPSGCLRRFDVIIVSACAHWVGSDGALALEQCIASRPGIGSEEAARVSQAYIADLYKRQMHRDAAHFSSIASRPQPQPAGGESGADTSRRTRILFRTSPPGYPTPDLLPSDTAKGVPPIFTAPSHDLEWAQRLARRNSSRFNHHLIPKFNGISRHAYRSAGLDIMDVEQPMMYRVDGHLDPLHYCLRA